MPVPADQFYEALGPSPGPGCSQQQRQLRHPSTGLGSGITAPGTGAVRLGPSGIIQPGRVTVMGRVDRVGPGVTQGPRIEKRSTVSTVALHRYGPESGADDAHAGSAPRPTQRSAPHDP
jgi:hypothetical protein